ncbi:MAG: serine--tRNA ligase, partial [Candidatus Micrarchaeia archaeon]
MLDIKLIRKDAEAVKKALRDRNQDAGIVDKLTELDAKWRQDKAEAEALRAERNKLGLAISEAKKQGKDASGFVRKSGEVSARAKELGEEVERLEKELDEMMLQVPNIPDKSVKIGKDESGNQEVRKWGEPGKVKGLAHDEIGLRTGLLDFERGSKLGGHRFTVMYGKMAKLERALGAFMLNAHAARGYMEVWVPHLVKSEIMQGTGQLPKFKEDLYKTDDDLWLIPTAEVPLTNLHAGEVLELADLPKRYMALTPCYRKEAGAYGKDIKGMIRQHQFDKVELVKVCEQEKSFHELELMVKDAENVLQMLGIPYRVIELCTGDLGFASAKTYDLEVWMPSQK